MKFGFATRIALMLAVILSASVIITGVLIMHKYERTFADFLTSQFEFVTNDIRDHIETRMDLGLNLADLQGISEDLEVYKRANEQILSIEVFDKNGTVLFSTDPSFVDDLVSEEWIMSSRMNRSRGAWSGQDRKVGVTGVPLYNNLDQYVGALALRYGLEPLQASVVAQTSRVFFISASTVIGMALISFLGALLLLRRPLRDLRGLQSAMEDIAERRADGDALARARAEHADFGTFAAAALAAHDALDAGTREIRRLDEEEAI